MSMNLGGPAVSCFNFQPTSAAGQQAFGNLFQVNPQLGAVLGPAMSQQNQASQPSQVHVVSAMSNNGPTMVSVQQQPQNMQQQQQAYQQQQVQQQAQQQQVTQQQQQQVGANNGQQPQQQAAGTSALPGGPPATPVRKIKGKKPDEEWFEKARKALVTGILPIKCKSLEAKFHVNKYGSGGKGKSVEMPSGEFLTICELECRGCNKVKTTDAYRYILFEGLPMYHLLNEGNIRRHSRTSCFCRICTDGKKDEPVLWDGETRPGAVPKKKAPVKPKQPKQPPGGAIPGVGGQMPPGGGGQMPPGSTEQPAADGAGPPKPKRPKKTKKKEADKTQQTQPAPATIVVAQPQPQLQGQVMQQPPMAHQGQQLQQGANMTTLANFVIPQQQQMHQMQQQVQQQQQQQQQQQGGQQHLLQQQAGAGGGAAGASSNYEQQIAATLFENFAGNFDLSAFQPMFASQNTFSYQPVRPVATAAGQQPQHAPVHQVQVVPQPYAAAFYNQQQQQLQQQQAAVRQQQLQQQTPQQQPGQQQQINTSQHQQVNTSQHQQIPVAAYMQNQGHALNYMQNYAVGIPVRPAPVRPQKEQQQQQQPTATSQQQQQQFLNPGGPQQRPQMPQQSNKQPMIMMANSNKL